MTHWRQLLLVLVLSALLFGGLFTGGDAPSAQAGGSWSAWVYQPESHTLVHVFPDGVPAVSTTLPLPPGVTSPPYSVVISRDGARLAGCFVDDASQTSVRIYDLYGGVYLSQYIVPGGPVQGCLLGRYAFSEDGSLLAVGILNHYPGMADARLAGSCW